MLVGNEDGSREPELLSEATVLVKVLPGKLSEGYLRWSPPCPVSRR